MSMLKQTTVLQAIDTAEAKNKRLKTKNLFIKKFQKSNVLYEAHLCWGKKTKQFTSKDKT